MNFPRQYGLQKPRLQTPQVRLSSGMPGELPGFEWERGVRDGPGAHAAELELCHLPHPSAFGAGEEETLVCQL